jgi:hypothetical protein
LPYRDLLTLTSSHMFVPGMMYLPWCECGCGYIVLPVGLGLAGLEVLVTSNCPGQGLRLLQGRSGKTRNLRERLPELLWECVCTRAAADIKTGSFAYRACVVP